jgi:hypothetical protein
MSSLADRQNELQSKISTIDREIESLDAQFLALAAEFNSTDSQSSLRAAEQIERALMDLRRQKAVIIAAQGHTTRAQLAEKAVQADNDRRAVLATAKQHADAVCTLNAEIDEHLIKLRQMFERRFALLSQLAATGVVDQAFVTKLQSRAGPTRACCAAGLAKWISVEKVATQSFISLASCNVILLGIGREGPSSSSPSEGTAVADAAVPAPTTNGGELAGIPASSTNGADAPDSSASHPTNGEPERRRRRWGIGNG